MKISSVGVVGQRKVQPSFRKANSSNVQKLSDSISFKGEQKTSKFKKAVPFLLVGAGAALGVGAGLLIAKKKGDISSLAEVFTSKADKNQDKTWMAILALAGISGYEAGKLNKKDIDEIVEKLTNNEAPIQRATRYHSEQIDDIKSVKTNATLRKYTKDFNGLTLLDQNNILNRNLGKYNKAIENIQTVGQEKLTSKSPIKPIEKENPVLWSITSEFAPIKEGGLGSVPPEIRNNVVKLGVEIPTFVPMYLNDGNSSFTQRDDEYIYNHKGKEFKLEKVMTFKTDTFKNGKLESTPVDIFLHEQNGAQLVFVKCDKYFDGTIYEGNGGVEEPEKFALMSKAVYELAKIKMDGIKATKDSVIYSQMALDDIKAPDGMILNDWQASPIAALARYKALMENAHGQLSDDTAQKLKDMRIITIGHNVMYQGSTQSNNDYHQRKNATNNILNTLFDKYTYDIVSNAKSGATKIDPKDKGLENLDNVLVMNYKKENENHTNFLNMGIILSDYFHPVSQNYADELISDNHRDLSYSLQWALVQKAKAGKLVGVINGNDFDNLSIEAKLPQIKKLTGLDFVPYTKKSSLEELKDARLENKINFYNNFILPFTESKASSKEAIEDVKALSSRLEFYQGEQGTKMPILTDEEIKETPFLISGGRFVSQKGIDVLCDAVKMLFDNWEDDFGDKPKPIFYIAGAVGAG